MYSYFHIYLQRQWDLLSIQPAITVDGIALDRRVHGWIVLGLVRRHFVQLTERPPWFRLQSLLCALLVWWVVPLTVVAFWWRYTRRHDVIGSVWLIVMVALALQCAQTSRALAAHTLRSETLPKVRWWQHGLTACVVVALWTFTMLAVKTDARTPLLDADLVNSNLSSPPDDWPALTASLPEPRDDTSDLTAILFASAVTKTPVRRQLVLRFSDN